jgi:hypothetical protein
MNSTLKSGSHSNGTYFYKLVLLKILKLFKLVPFPKQSCIFQLYGSTVEWSPSWNTRRTRTTLVLLACKSSREDWKGLWRNPTKSYLSLSKPVGNTARWAIWFQSQTWHILQAGPPRWKRIQELWWESANRRGFPRCGQSIRHRMGWRPFLEAHGPRHPLLPGEKHLILPARSAVPKRPSFSLWHEGWRGAGGINLLCPLQSVCQWHARPSHQVELALYANDTAVIATSRKPTLLVSYLEAYLADLNRWLRKWRIAINVSKSTAMLFTRRRIQNPRPVILFEDTISRMSWYSPLSGGDPW